MRDSPLDGSPWHVGDCSGRVGLLLGRPSSSHLSPPTVVITLVGKVAGISPLYMGILHCNRWWDCALVNVGFHLLVCTHSFSLCLLLLLHSFSASLRPQMRVRIAWRHTKARRQPLRSFPTSPPFLPFPPLPRPCKWRRML